MKEENRYNYCHIVGRTDIGCKRQANEDNMNNFETINGLVSVVCDGMGGHVGGATASRIAIEAIYAFLDTKFCEDPREAIGEAIDAANQAILHQCMIQPELQGMGSTCVLLLVRDAKVYIGHVGDSRIYLIRNRRIRQLTKDHSYVQMLVDMGQLTHEQAERHPRKNEITNALGIPNMKPATVQSEPIVPEAGDCFLLCSDGLSGMVSDKEIEKIVSRQSEMGSQDRADYLVQRAKENGGLDNITVQLVEFSITPTSSKKFRKKPIIILGIVFLLCVGGGVGYYFWYNHSAKSSVEKMNKTIESRTVEEISTIPPVEFQANKAILEIEYGKKGCTEILMGGEVVYTIPKVLTADSLKYDDEIRAQLGNHQLAFRNECKTEQSWFSLSDSFAIYRFNLHVEKGRLPQSPPATGSSANAKVTGKGFTSTVVGAGMGDNMEYAIEFKFTPNQHFLSFFAGDEAHFEVLNPKVKFELNCNLLKIENATYDSKYFKKLDFDPTKGFNISFTQKEPPSDLEIKIVGKVKEKDSNSILRNIIIKLKKVK